MTTDPRVADALSLFSGLFIAAKTDPKAERIAELLVEIKEAKNDKQKTALQLETLEALKIQNAEKIQGLTKAKECSSQFADLLTQITKGGDVNDDVINQFQQKCPAESTALLKTIRDQKWNQPIDARQEQSEVNIREKERLAGSSPSLIFLHELKRLVSISKEVFTDSDFNEVCTDALKYGVSKFNMERPAAFEKEFTIDILNQPEGSDEEEAFVEVINIIIQKAGNIRMMVRFNNTAVPGHLSVRQSYMIQDEQQNEQQNALDFDENRTFRGYQFDSNQHIKSTLYCNQEFGNTTREKLIFERVFLEENQASVYDSLKSFIFTAQHGKPLGIFGYGGTGSGKTYTLLGPSDKDRSPENEGILGRVVRDLWVNHVDVNKLEVKMMEIHPYLTTSNNVNEHNSTPDVLTYRCLDLVELEKNKNVTVKNGKVVFKQSTTSQYISYYTMSNHTTSENQQTQAIVKKQSFVPNFDEVYTPNTADRFKSKSISRETFIKEGPQNALVYSKGPDNTEKKIDTIMKEINNVLAYRRSFATDGNKTGSSRSHLIVTLKIYRQNGYNIVYIVDMAGKEYAKEKLDNAFHDSNLLSRAKKITWHMSRGINQSLDGFMRLLAVTKCKWNTEKSKRKSFDHRVKDSTVTVAHKYLINQRCNTGREFMPHVNDKGKRSSYISNNQSTLFDKIGYYNDPLYFLTEELWTDPEAKIMLFACMYPLVQIKVQGKSKNLETFPKSWDIHWGIEENDESLEDKFKRDMGILREMDYVQEIRKKDVVVQDKPGTGKNKSRKGRQI